MSNYESIKNMDIDIMASLLAQISSCAKYSFNELPNKDDWKNYLLGNSMFLPFDSRECKS